MMQGRLSEALVAAQREATAQPEDLDVQERLIDLLLTLRLPAVARRRYQARVSAHPEDPDAHYLLGRAEVDADLAQRAYERALRINPDHARAYMGVAAIHLAKRRLPEAEQSYRMALSLDPSLAEAWSGLVNVFVLEGAAEPALQVAKRAIKTVPTAAEGYLNVAMLEPELAITVLSVGARRTEDPRVRAALAEALLAKGEPSGALDAANAALAVDPTNASAGLTRIFARDLLSGSLDPAGYAGLLQAQHGDGPEAFAALVRDYPSSALVWMGRAQAYKAQGDPAAALADLSEAVRQAPEEPEAAAAYGLALMQAKEATQARPWLQLAARARPWDPALAVAAGRSTLASGDTPTAVQELSQAWKSFPYDGAVAIALGDAMAASGDVEGAYRVIRQAAERIEDVRLPIALALAAKGAGHRAEAADILERLGEQTGSERILQEAKALRTP